MTWNQQKEITCDGVLEEPDQSNLPYYGDWCCSGASRSIYISREQVDSWWETRRGDSKVDRYCKSHIYENGTCSKSVELATRMRLLKCYVWSSLLYCCESWTVIVITQLQAAEMWFLCRMLRTKWTDKVTNEEVLQHADSSRELVTTIATRQIRFLIHILRKEKLKELVLTGRSEGKRARGRQRLTFLSWLYRTTGVKPLELITMLNDRREKEAVTAV